MAYSRQQQNMDFKWQIARKLDRLDLGEFAALPFFYRNAIIYGFVRAIDPEEPKAEESPDQNPPKTIPELINTIDDRINELLEYDTTAILMGKTNLEEVKVFQKKTMATYYDLDEVIYRCKLTDNVRTMEAEAP